jgi:hypothetical protein
MWINTNKYKKRKEENGCKTYFMVQSPHSLDKAEENHVTYNQFIKHKGRESNLERRETEQ